jgi:ABC-2 type transport system ATP-binding protein
VLHNPSLIILDEPFSGLDPVNSNLIKDEIFNLAKNGATVIFSTHRMEQVEEICDKIVLVNKGQKILDGKVSEIKQDFKQNLYSLAATQLPGNIDSPALTVRINEGYKPNDVLSYFMNQGAGIISFHEILPSLNEIFIRLVEGTPTARQFQKVTA